MINFLKENGWYEIFSYAFFGVITTCINLLLYWFFLKIGIHYLISNIISFAIAVVLSYYFNKKWVFVSIHEGTGNQFFKFVMVRILAIGIDSVLLYLAVDILLQDEMISKFIISGGIIFATYIVNKIYVFGKGKSKDEEIH